eukprot:GHUV01025257.1.p1 GENE.GHUV01025257.1~~GHUV01025257.1.p1  ORF type:complete len:369 (+),score=91.73 GHUV01025257.1:959-2065(+)
MPLLLYMLAQLTSLLLCHCCAVLCCAVHRRDESRLFIQACTMVVGGQSELATTFTAENIGLLLLCHCCADRRDENRLFIKNCTMVVGGQSELDYYLYWATVYHSSLPYFKQLAKFIRDVIQITVWELADAGQGDSSIFVVHEVAGSCTVEDSLYTVNDVVAPKLPAPPVDPGLQLNTAAKSPLVTAVSTVASLREQLKPLGPSEAGRTHVVLLRTNITLPAATAGSNSGLGTDVPPGGLPVPHPITILGDFSNQVPAVLDMGYARSLLALPRDAQADQVQVQHLVLKGLAQGPAAAVATSLAFPDVWTILAWAFNRSTDKSVSFSACTLELPPQEFEALQQQATVGGGQVILKMTGVRLMTQLALLVC